MIYIAKGVCMPCKLCEKCCGSCCEGISKFCDCISKCCGGICSGISHCFSGCFGPIIHNPLGGYVIGTWVVMALVIACFICTITEVTCDGPKIVAYVDITFAVVHAIFAFYIQRRLICAIGEQAVQEMTHSEIAARARHVMAYDVGFCLYFFIFCGSFVYNCTVFGVLSQCGGSGPGWSGAALLLMYGLGVWHYAICWFACQCCCGTYESAVQKREAPTGTGTGAGAGGVILGAPAPDAADKA